jgi:hypothetical protein
MAKKTVKKPVRRKGYDEGGKIDVLGGLDKLKRAYASSPQDDESTRRYVAAGNALTSSAYNELSPEAQKNYRDTLDKTYGTSGKLGSGRDLETGRASYPGFAKGGKVRKVAKAAVKWKR